MEREQDITQAGRMKQDPPEQTTVIGCAPMEPGETYEIPEVEPVTLEEVGFGED